MATLSHAEDQKFITFKAQCDQFNKYCAALLGLVIPLSTAATHIVLLCFMFSWFLGGNLQAKLKTIWIHPIAQAFLFLFGIFVVGTFYSVAPLEDRIELLRKMAKFLYVPFLLTTLSEKECRSNAMWAFLAAMLFTFLFGAIKLTVGLMIYKAFPLAAVFKDPIYTNFMMAFAGFIAFHYLFQPFSLRLKIIFFSLGMLFTFYVFFMSMGRTGQVVFVVLWLLFCLQRFSMKKLGAGLALLILLLGLVNLTSKNFQSIASTTISNIEGYQMGETHTSVGARLEYFRETWQLVKEHPWFGFGTGSFKEIYKNHAIKNHLQITQNPHNEYLNTLFQLGVTGLIALLGFFAFLFKKSFNLSYPEQTFAQGIVIAIVVGCFANSWLMDFTSGYFFVILIAISFGALKVNRDFCGE